MYELFHNNDLQLFVKMISKSEQLESKIGLKEGNYEKNVRCQLPTFVL